MAEEENQTPKSNIIRPDNVSQSVSQEDKINEFKNLISSRDKTIKDVFIEGFSLFTSQNIDKQDEVIGVLENLYILQKSLYEGTFQKMYESNMVFANALPPILNNLQSKDQNLDSKLPPIIDNLNNKEENLFAKELPVQQVEIIDIDNLVIDKLQNMFSNINQFDDGNQNFTPDNNYEGDLLKKLVGFGLASLFSVGALSKFLPFAFTDNPLQGFGTMISKVMVYIWGAFEKNVIDIFKNSKIFQVTKSTLTKILPANKLTQILSEVFTVGFAKRIPILGSFINWGDSLVRINNGDYIGGLISFLSGSANLFPGVGTAISFALDLLNVGKDVYESRAIEGENIPWTQKINDWIADNMRNLPILGTAVRIGEGLAYIAEGEVVKGLKIMASSLISNTGLDMFISFLSSEEDKEENVKNYGSESIVDALTNLTEYLYLKVFDYIEAAINKGKDMVAKIFGDDITNKAFEFLGLSQSNNDTGDISIPANTNVIEARKQLQERGLNETQINRVLRDNQDNLDFGLNLKGDKLRSEDEIKKFLQQKGLSEYEQTLFLRRNQDKVQKDDMKIDEQIKATKEVSFLMNESVNEIKRMNQLLSEQNNNNNLFSSVNNTNRVNNFNSTSNFSLFRESMRFGLQQPA